MSQKTAKEILSMVDANSRNDLINRLMSRSEKLLQLSSAMYGAPYSQINKANVREALEDAKSAFDVLEEYDAASQREEKHEFSLPPLGSGICGFQPWPQSDPDLHCGKEKGHEGNHGATTGNAQTTYGQTLVNDGGEY